jgi:hypothetical protein
MLVNAAAAAAILAPTTMLQRFVHVTALLQQGLVQGLHGPQEAYEA